MAGSPTAEVPNDDAALAAVGRIVASIGSDDLELHEPPAGLWDRIAAAVATDAAADAAAADAEPERVEYRIDADDLVTPVGPGWSAFAAENDGPAPDGAGRRTLWSFFDSDDIRIIWQLVVQRVRGTGSPVVLPLRCDAPGVRRWFDLTVTPSPDGSVHFACNLVRRERREPVALLSPRTPRDPGAAPIPVCSWCAKADDGTAWVDVEDLVASAGLLARERVPAVSYGICGACRGAMAADVLVPAGASD